MSGFTVLLLIYLKVLITSSTKSHSVACLDGEHLGKTTLMCSMAGQGGRMQQSCSSPADGRTQAAAGSVGELVAQSPAGSYPSVT